MSQITERQRRHWIDLDKIRARRRREVGVGLLALLLMAVIVVGIPLALVALFGWPLPRSVPTQDVLTAPVTSEIILNAIACLVWLAWLHLLVCLFVEWRAGRRGVGLSRRIPMAGFSQDLARRLVAAVLLLTTASAAVSATAARSYHAPQPTAVAGRQTPAPRLATPVPPQGSLSGPAEHRLLSSSPPAVASPRAHGPLMCVVMPPRGRYHDNLWDIAERHLGDGLRYKEIFALNEGRVQPDGRKLTHASLIQPGWELLMPADAKRLPAAAPHAPPEVAAQAASGALGPPSAAAAQPRAGGRSDPARVAEPTVAAAAGQVTPAGATVPVVPTRSSVSSAPVGRPPAQWPAAALWGLFGVELLAVGVLEALLGLRKRQARRRETGQPLPRPAPAAAALETALRSRADSQGALFLDHALRSLALGGATVPDIYAARLTEYRLELWLAVPRSDAPSPFAVEDGGRVWAAAREAGLPAVADVGAPMPGLVSVGHDGSGPLMIDFESADGIVSVDGPAARSHALLAAAAAELATNAWSDEVRVTLVGFGEELVALAPSRVRWVADVAGVLPQIEARATSVPGAAADDAVLTGCHREVRVPEYVLLAEPPDHESLRRLSALATGSRRGVGVLVAGAVPGARWSFTIDASGILNTGPLGLQVQAAQLGEPAYLALAELLGSATLGLEDPDVDPSSPQAPADALGIPGPADRHLRSVLPPRQLVPEFPSGLDPDLPPVRLVRLLGSPDIFGGPQDAAPTPLLVEMTAYLAVFREGVSLAALTAAIWPRGSRAGEREAALAQLAEWLADDDAGRPRLMQDDAGWLRLSPQVRLDWHQFVALTTRGQGGDLRRALELVRGTVAEGASANRYGWLAETALPYEAPPLIVDTAHRLAAAYLGRGDAAGAANAARLGLRIDDSAETLWRDLVRAEQTRGGTDAARSAAEDMVSALQRSGGLDQVSAESEAVIQALLRPRVVQAQDA
ncbi:MAG: hypothetical protein ABJA34_08055 [Pseudonocardiales bacterium]